MQFSRRELTVGLAASGALVGCPSLLMAKSEESRPGDKMQYGLVTYLWGQSWKLPQLISNCEQAGCLGVELRSTHAHGVEPGLNKQQRKEVARRFADSEVTLVGLGSNERFDNPEAAVVRKAIDATKAFIVLSHDVGSSGVKVKPDRFYPNVPRQQTIEQIGRSLNELGEFAGQYGQQVRLEVDGQCAELPTIKAIMDVAQNKNVAVCWNSNAADLTGKGITENFQLVRDRFGATLHVRELESRSYPYARLIQLLVQSDYAGWGMMEASSKPENPVAALAAQVRRFRKMVVAAQTS